MGSLLPVCLVCGHTPKGGMRSGLFIKGKFLCSGCEGEIVALDPLGERYRFYCRQLKKIWL